MTSRPRPEGPGALGVAEEVEDRPGEGGRVAGRDAQAGHPVRRRAPAAPRCQRRSTARRSQRRRQRPAHRRRRLTLAVDVEHVPERRPTTGCPANVMRSAIRRRSARRRRSTSSSPWPAITNSASTPASRTRRGRSGTLRTPRPPPAARPCRSRALARSGRDRGRLGGRDPGGHHRSIGPGTPRLRARSSASSRLRRSTPGTIVDSAGADPPGPGTHRSSGHKGVANARRSPGRRAPSPHAGRASTPGPFNRPTEVEPADTPGRASDAQGRALDDPVVRARPVRPRDAERLRRDPPAAPDARGTNRIGQQSSCAPKRPARSRILHRSSIASPLALCDIQIRSRSDGPQPITSPRSQAGESSQCRRDSPAGNPRIPSKYLATGTAA